MFHWLNKKIANKTLSKTELERKQYISQGKIGNLKRIFTDHDIKTGASIWAEPLRLIDSASKRFPTLSIRYESMLQDQENVFKQLYHFIGVNSSTSIIKKCVDESSFERMTGRNRGQEEPISHIRKGISNDWLNTFTKQDGELFQEIAGDMLMRYGYIESTTWWEQLPETLT